MADLINTFEAEQESIKRTLGWVSENEMDLRGMRGHEREKQREKNHEIEAFVTNILNSKAEEYIDMKSSTITSTTGSPNVTSTVSIDVVDKNNNSSNVDTSSFDINKITNVEKIDKVPDNEGTYRPVKSTNVVGDGILDKLLETVRLNLDAQRKSGRIRQEEYAQAYVALTQAAIQAAVNLILQGDIAAKEATLKSLQGELYVKELAIKDAMLAKEAEQIATYQRQRIAYDEDFLVKASSHLMDSYIAFLTSMPNVDNQKYPLMFTGTGDIQEFNDDPSIATKTTPGINEEQKADRLSLMDGVMSRLYQRIATYQKDQFHNPKPETNDE